MADPKDSLEVFHERTAALSEGLKDLREAVRDLDRRFRSLETEEIEALRRQVCRLENKADSFESAHDDNREKWNMALNFVVQLMWVATASFVLTKLGLTTGPL